MARKIAIVIHPLRLHGGAEYNFKVIADQYPNADIFTAWYDKKFTDEYFPGKKIHSTFLQKLLPLKRLTGSFVPLEPYAYKTLNLSDYDVVIVLSDGFEKCVRFKDPKKAVLIVLTPPRYLWLETRSENEKKTLPYKLYHKLLEPILHPYWRNIDRKSAQNFGHHFGISAEIQKRNAKYYDVNSKILYPPVELDSVKYNDDINSRDDYYLYFGRVVKYKGVDQAIRACAENGYKLKIAGGGADLEEMKELVKELKAESRIEILGYVTDEEKSELLYNCRAMLYPVSDEDFGIVPVEANAAGCPVIGYNNGGVKETITHMKSGVLYDEYSAEGIIKAMKQLRESGISAHDCQTQSKNFSRERFESNLKQIVDGISKR